MLLGCIKDDSGFLLLEESNAQSHQLCRNCDKRLVKVLQFENDPGALLVQDSSGLI